MGGAISEPSIDVGEQALRNALAANLDGCFDKLVLIYSDRLYGFALRLLHSPQDAEEVVQDAFVRAYHALETYPVDRVQTLALRPWLYQITLNVLRNRVRGRHLHAVPIDDVAPDDLRPSETFVPPDVYAERAERSRELQSVIAGLPDRFRLAVVLRHIEGFSYNELVDLLGQPTGTIKANVHRGLKLLRHALETRMAQEDL